MGGMKLIEKIKTFFNKKRLVEENSKLLPPIHELPFEGVNLEKIILKKIKKLNKEKRANGELELSPFEKVRLIEVTLAQYIQFDPRFILYSVLEKEGSHIYNREPDITRWNDPNVVCKTWTQVMKVLLIKIVGLDEEQIEVNDTFHMSITVKNLEHRFINEETGKMEIVTEEYRLDSTKDYSHQQPLFLLKEKLLDDVSPKDSYDGQRRVNLFSFLPTKFLSNKYAYYPISVLRTNKFFTMLEQVDKRIGYISNTLGYNNVFFDILREEFSMVYSGKKVPIEHIGSTVEDEKTRQVVNSLQLEVDDDRIIEDDTSIFKKKFEFLIKVLKIQNMHVLEATQYVRFAIKHCFSNEELEKNTIKNKEVFYKKNGKIYFLNIFYIKQGERYLYYVLDPMIPVTENQIYSISLKELQNFSKKNNLKIASGMGEIPGLSLKERPKEMGTPLIRD